MKNLYKDAENDIIDDLKDEIKYLKQKIKEHKQREEGFENGMEMKLLKDNWIRQRWN